MSEENDSRWEELAKLGLGVALFAKDTLANELDRLLEKHDLDSEERADIKTKLVERTREESQKLKASYTDFVEKQIEKAGLAKEERVRELEEKISKLEERLDEIES